MFSFAAAFAEKTYQSAKLEHTILNLFASDAQFTEISFLNFSLCLFGLKIKEFVMQLVCFFLLFLATLFTSLDAQAGNFEVTPIIGYAFGGGLEDSTSGDTLDLADGENYGVVLGLRDKSKAGAFYEFLYSRQSTYLKGDGMSFSGDPHFDIEIDYFHLGGSYGSEGETFNPYVSAGVGVTHMSPEWGDSETRFSFSLGGGIKIPLAEHIGLRVEGRGFGTVFDGNSSIFCVNNRCAVRVKGDVIWQFTGFTGVVFSF